MHLKPCLFFGYLSFSGAFLMNVPGSRSLFVPLSFRCELIDK
ncbi:hypothetical protein KKH3_40080 [Pectobacterium actinidiae]|nr:hypothetical protein KKH3_40080 [Pectobacterium actinidiae]